MEIIFFYIYGDDDIHHSGLVRKSVGAATALPFRLKRGGCPSHKNTAKDPRKRKQG